MPESAQFERDDGSDGNVLMVRGEIDVAVAEDFRRESWALIQNGNSPAFINLSAVTFMDSSGVDVLAAAKRRAAGSDVELVLVEPSRPARLVLAVTEYLDASPRQWLPQPTGQS